jgi:hypothetical protein
MYHLFWGFLVRVRITRKLAGSIDGIQLGQFQPGRLYEVGRSLGSYLLAEHAAEPAFDEADDEPRGIDRLPPLRADTRRQLSLTTPVAARRNRNGGK